MNIGDRLKLLTDYSVGSLKIPAGTICTLINILDSESKSFIIRYGADFERDLHAGISSTSVILADLNDLDSINYDKIVSVHYHIGTKFVAEKAILNKCEIGNILEILKVYPRKNENNDMFALYNAPIGETFYLTKANIDGLLTRYIPELHDHLGEEINPKTSIKNYYLLGAKMIAFKNDMVYIKSILGDNKFTIEYETGHSQTCLKEDLTPIVDFQELLSLPYFHHVDFKPQTKYIANESISHNFLLNNKIKPFDVVEIIDYNEISIDIHEDTYIVKLPINENIVLSTYEIQTHFDKVNGMYKTVPIKSSEISLDEFIDKAIKEKPPLGPNIKINELSVNGYLFNVKDDIVQSDQEFHINEIDDFVESLIELKKFLKQGE